MRLNPESKLKAFNNLCAKKIVKKCAKKDFFLSRVAYQITAFATVYLVWSYYYIVLII